MRPTRADASLGDGSSQQPHPVDPPASSDLADVLAAIAQLTMSPAADASVATLARVCGVIRDVLGAEAAHVMRAGEGHFVQIDHPGDPTAYEFKQQGYAIIRQHLVTHPQSVGSLVQGSDRRVHATVELAAGVPATHLALLLPTDESAYEMLIVRGPWPGGLTPAHVAFVTAVRPMVTHLIGNVLDTFRRERLREQLLSLGNVATAVTRAGDATVALGSVATALAKSSGFEWATITLIDEALARVTARVYSNSRYSETMTAIENRESEVMLTDALGGARYVAATRRPLLYPTLEMPDHELPIWEETVRLLHRANILATSTFPLFSGERLLGTVNFTSSRPHAFDSEEVEFLQLLCAQAVLAVDWLELHRELRDANAALARAATHDGLTGLPNRTLLLDRLNQALDRNRRNGQMVGLLFVDLDDFKLVNDTFGHHMGDRLLQVIAQRLQSTLRVGDTAARLGGDEFTVLLENLDDEGTAYLVAERLRAAVARPAKIEGHTLAIRASIGVACSGTTLATAEMLLRAADAAMYRLKADVQAPVRLPLKEPAPDT